MYAMHAIYLKEWSKNNIVEYLKMIQPSITTMYSGNWRCEDLSRLAQFLICLLLRRSQEGDLIIMEIEDAKCTNKL